MLHYTLPGGLDEFVASMILSCSDGVRSAPIIGMLKLSALVSGIGVRELLLIADQAASSNFRYLEALSAAGFYYLALTTVFMTVQNRIEWALRPERATPPMGFLSRSQFVRPM